MRENLKQVITEHYLESRLNLSLEWIITNLQLNVMAFHCKLLPNGDIKVGPINVVIQINRLIIEMTIGWRKKLQMENMA